MLVEDEAGLAALLEDPSAHGEDWDPTRWLAPGITWDAIAKAEPAVREAIRRRWDHVRVAVVSDPTAQAEAEALAQGFREDLDVISIEAGVSTEDLGKRVIEALPGGATRLLLVVVGDAGPLVLEALHGSVPLRDGTVGVVFVGCPVGGVATDPPPGLDRSARRSWNEKNFHQEPLDTELRRSTPYVFVPRLDLDAALPGDGRVAWEDQRLDEPGLPPSGRRPVQVVDLGPIVKQTPLRQVARALTHLLVALSSA